MLPNIIGQAADVLNASSIIISHTLNTMCIRQMVKKLGAAGITDKRVLRINNI